MKKRFILFLAFKYLNGHKLRASLTIGGIAIGIGFITFLISLGTGLKQVSTSQIANLEALSIMDVTSGKSKIVTISDNSIEKIQRLGDIDRVLASVSIPSRIEYKGSVIDAVMYGKNLDTIALEELKLEKGRLQSNNEEKSIVVNTALLKQLGIKNFEDILNKDIKVSFTIRQDLLSKEAKEASDKENTFKIVGISNNEDAAYFYIPLNVLESYGLEKFTHLKVKATSKEKVDSVKKKIEGLGYRVTAIKNTVDQVNQFFVLFQLIILSFGLVAIIVAGIGMFNTLTISLLEKTREIGFMKALGTTRGDVYRIFITESVIIGTMGGLLGISFGYFIGVMLNNNIIRLAEDTGNKSVELFYLPFEYMIYIFCFAFVVSLLTGLYPSFRASRINPLDALRYE